MSAKSYVEKRAAAKALTNQYLSTGLNHTSANIKYAHDGEEISSFAKANAEQRLPGKAVIFYSPKADQELVKNVVKRVAEASSPEDILWDPLLTYYDNNKRRIRHVVMTKEEAIAKVLSLSQAKGTLVYDDTGAKLKGVYDINQGIVFTHKPKTQQHVETEEELILEAQIFNESVEEQLLLSQAKEEPEVKGNSVVIFRADENGLTLPPTKTLEKKTPAVNISRPLENSSLIIAFIFEDELADRRVETAELGPTVTIASSSPTAEKKAMSASQSNAILNNNPFLKPRDGDISY